jgi:mRNA interferase RelE/StbE
VIYRLQISAGARRKMTEYAKSDPRGMDLVLDTINLLTTDPRPRGAQQYGSRNTLRIHIGAYRLLYEVSDSTVTIALISLGKVP